MSEMRGDDVLRERFSHGRARALPVAEDRSDGAVHRTGVAAFDVLTWGPRLGGHVHCLDRYGARGLTAVTVDPSGRLVLPHTHLFADDQYLPETISYARDYLPLIGFMPVAVRGIPCTERLVTQELIMADSSTLEWLVAQGAHDSFEAFDPQPETDRLLDELERRALCRGISMKFRTLRQREAALLGDKAQARLLATEQGWSGYLENQVVSLQDGGDEAWHALRHFLHTHDGRARIKDPGGASGVGAMRFTSRMSRRTFFDFLAREVHSEVLVIEEDFGPHLSCSVLFNVTPHGWVMTGGTRQILTRSSDGSFTEHVGNVISAKIADLLPDSWYSHRTDAHDTVMHICAPQLDWAVARGWDTQLGVDVMIRRSATGVNVKVAEWNVRQTGAMPGNGTRLQANLHRTGSVVCLVNAAFHGNRTDVPSGWEEAYKRLGDLAYSPATRHGIVLNATSMLAGEGEGEDCVRKAVLHAVGDTVDWACHYMEAARRRLNADRMEVTGFGSRNTRKI